MQKELTPQQTRQRLAKILDGAFKGPPTPLKDIPKKSGESRKTRRKSTEPKSS